MSARLSKSFRPPAVASPQAGPLLCASGGYFSRIHNHSAYALIERDKTKPA